MIVDDAAVEWPTKSAELSPFLRSLADEAKVDFTDIEKARHFIARRAEIRSGYEEAQAIRRAHISDKDLAGRFDRIIAALETLHEELDDFGLEFQSLMLFIENNKIERIEDCPTHTLDWIERPLKWAHACQDELTKRRKVSPNEFVLPPAKRLGLVQAARQLADLWFELVEVPREKLPATPVPLLRFVMINLQNMAEWNGTPDAVRKMLTPSTGRKSQGADLAMEN